jgi:transcriptional regulator with PAS, ATPase and Fis domain
MICGDYIMENNNEFSIMILENMNVGIFVLDSEGNYLYVNNEYCKVVNKPREFFECMSIPKLIKLGYLSYSVWEQVIEKKAPVTQLVTLTDIKNNKIYQTLTTGKPTFNPDGSIKYIFYTQELIENISKRIQTGILNQSFITNLNEIKTVSQIDFIAESPQMKQLLYILSRVSNTDASVLITGPSGSGKEVLAKYIHQTSMRSEGPFVVLNCASIPENLIESELYGYEKGAFSGAASSGKKGLIEAANGGTLFLDEINSMPLGFQTKLLRVLENKQVMRVGSVIPKEINFRLICASNEDLKILVNEKHFRLDLFYRINVAPICIPPLSERKEDIIPLTIYFLQFFCKKYSRIKTLSEDVIKVMLSYEWPGNVRELRNFIESLIITSPDTEWQISYIPKWLLQQDEIVTPPSILPDNLPLAMDTHVQYDETFSLNSYMDECEKQLLRNILAQYKSPSNAAKILKLDLSNVYRKIKKYNL